MTQHTPGPWKTTGANITDANRNHVATVTDGGTTDGEANARLIAAAPELLAALKDIAETQWANGVPSSGALREARAAIAKAEGAAP